MPSAITQVMSVRVPNRTAIELHSLAATRGITTTELMREAVRRGLPLVAGSSINTRGVGRMHETHGDPPARHHISLRDV